MYKFKKQLRLVILFWFAIFCWACASTNVRSQVDPQVRGRNYNCIMVFVNFQDLGLRQDTERQIQSFLTTKNSQVIPSVDLFFPGRTYTTEESNKILTDASVDGILVISSAGTGTSVSWLPQTTTTRGSATVTGNTVSGTATTSTYGGYNITKPWAEFDATLIDLTTKSVVWIARMSSRGNAFADWKDLTWSMAQETSSQLKKDKIIK